MGDRLDVIHLNLLSESGRAVAAQHGLRIVPATLLFGPNGALLMRHIGVPDLDELRLRLTSSPN